MASPRVLRIRGGYVRRAAPKRIPERHTRSPRIAICGDSASSSRWRVFRQYRYAEPLGVYLWLVADPGRLYLVLDDKVPRLLTRKTCAPLDIAKCTSSVKLVHGGDLGYTPHTADSIAYMIRGAAIIPIWWRLGYEINMHPPSLRFCGPCATRDT